jgi:uridine kinase
MNASHPVQLVAVTGGSGAGKGWFVDRLRRVVGDKAGHLQLDDFYRDLSHLPFDRRVERNFDVPDAIDWEGAERVLRACRTGEPTTIPSYNFATYSRSAGRRDWEPRPVVLVDGLWLLRRPAIRALFELKIYLDTPAELRRTRRLARDVTERGYSRDLVEHQLRTAVVPMHDRYVEPQKRWADVVLIQPFQEDQLADLGDRLWALLTRAALKPCWEHETFRADIIELLANHEYCH